MLWLWYVYAMVVKFKIKPKRKIKVPIHYYNIFAMLPDINTLNNTIYIVEEKNN